MYYEEKVVNGVLCHRSTPRGKWIPFTLEQLTEMVVKFQKDEWLRSHGGEP